MRKIIILAGNFLLLLFMYSCQKSDFKNPEAHDPSSDVNQNMRRGGNSGANFIYATSAWLSGGEDPDYRLFTKEYKYGKLSKITASIQNVVTGGLDNFPLKVRYGFRQMSFVDEQFTGQTVGIFRFDHKGNLTSASLGGSPFPFHHFQPITYRLYYSRGRLKEIKYQYDIDPQTCEDYPELCANPPTLHPYVKIQYDNHRNISAISTGETSTFKYEYDLKRKVKDQFYADEAIHDYFDFWFFLRYLDILPELRPQNLLVRSVYTSPEGYLTRLERKYHNQKFKDGRLTSYDVQTNSSYNSDEKSASSKRLSADESWKVYWDCK